MGDQYYRTFDFTSITIMKKSKLFPLFSLTFETIIKKIEKTEYDNFLTFN